MTLKPNDQGLIEIYLDGTLRFRPNKFPMALGREGAHYLAELQRLYPDFAKSEYPTIREHQAAATAAELTTIIDKTVVTAQQADVAVE